MRIRSSLAAAAGAAAALTLSLPAAAGHPLFYSMRTVERRAAPCSAGPEPPFCPHIRFTFPIFGPPAHPAAKAINAAIAHSLLTSTGEPRMSRSIDDAFDAFVRAYQDSGAAGSGSGYFEERHVEVPYLSGRIVSLTFDVDFFYGGLHQQFYRRAASFDARTGAALRLADVLVPGYERPLTRIGEDEFRRANAIPPGTTLREAGYVFPHDRFALPEGHFWIGAAGISFYYNLYEIASYAQGPTELLLPYARIRDLINPDGPLGAMPR